MTSANLTPFNGGSQSGHLGIASLAASDESGIFAHGTGGFPNNSMTIDVNRQSG